jgi:hypothetical protein
MIQHILYIALLSLLSLTAVHAQTPASSPSGTSANTAGPRITFDNTVHDFGLIAYKSPGTHTYVVTNTGTTPLIITNCIKGCGCTSVDWTKDSIMPGAKGLVRAAYDTRKVGHFSRGVDVFSNDSTNPKINLRLTGTVDNALAAQATVSPAAAPAPAGTQTAPAAKTNKEKW